jgi:predicted Holliday junction resolvase-like endonuclease
MIKVCLLIGIVFISANANALDYNNGSNNNDWFDNYQQKRDEEVRAAQEREAQEMRMRAIEERQREEEDRRFESTTGCPRSFRNSIGC